MLTDKVLDLRSAGVISIPQAELVRYLEITIIDREVERELAYLGLERVGATYVFQKGEVLCQTFQHQ